MKKSLLLYLLRWQLSTPILAILIYFLIEPLGGLLTTVLANFIGGLIFYNVDKYIFYGRKRKNNVS